MYYYRLISSMLKAVISSLGTGLYAVYKGESSALASLTTSLYAVYKAESNANDSLGTYNGTAQGGLTYSAGKSGNAFDFNGTNAYVKLPNSAFNSLTNDFTVSLWFYGNGSGVAQSLFSNVGYNGTIAKGLFIYQTTTYEIGTNIDGGGGRTSLQTTSIANSVWHHIVVTRLGSTRTRIYINGALATSNSDTRNPEYFTNNTPCIGALDYNPNFALTTYYASNGTKIDEVNIWNKELTSTEVTELYNSGNGKFYQGNAFYSTVVNDSLSTYNGTAVGGLTYTAGKSGNAFTFNGTNAYVKLPNSSLNSLTGDFSVSLWFYGNGSGVVQALFSNTGYNGTIDKGFWIYQTTAYEIITAIYGGGGTTSLKTTSITNGVWHHIVVTRLGSTRTRIYINGALATSNSDTRNPEYFTNNTPCIGALDYNPNFALTTYYAANGTKIDEVNVWNKELTSTEVTELYNTGAGKFYPY
jgi:hypothetical protein